MPNCIEVSERTPASAQEAVNASRMTLPRSPSASRTLEVKSRYGSNPSDPEMSWKKGPSTDTMSTTCSPVIRASNREANHCA